MLIFSFFVAPQLFKHLPAETAAPLMRQLFPGYYAFMAALGALAAATAASTHVREAIALAVIAGIFVLSRQILMPMSNRLYDAREAGDKSAEESFRKLHKLSMFLNLAQLIGAMVVLGSLAT